MALSTGVGVHVGLLNITVETDHSEPDPHDVPPSLTSLVSLLVFAIFGLSPRVALDHQPRAVP